ncbi:MAG: hypothetical protein ABEK59_10060 [Halobacteria archaeon]
MVVSRVKRIVKYFVAVGLLLGYLVLAIQLFGPRTMTLYIYLFGAAITGMLRIWILIESGEPTPSYSTGEGKEILIYGTGFSVLLFLVTGFLTFMRSDMAAAALCLVSLIVALVNYPEEAENTKYD